MYDPKTTSVSSAFYSGSFEYIVLQFIFERPRVVARYRDYCSALADIKKRRRNNRSGSRFHLTIINV